MSLPSLRTAAYAVGGLIATAAPLVRAYQKNATWNAGEASRIQARNDDIEQARLRAENYTKGGRARPSHPKKRSWNG